MRRQGTWIWTLTAWALVLAIGAAPAAPSSIGIERTIERIRADWAKPGAHPQPNAEGWNAFFDATRRDLAAYGAARSEDGRLETLGRLYQMSVALRGISWGPGAELREALRSWLGPRVRVAWAERRLTEVVRALPPTADASVRGNRDRWLEFIDEDLGAALRQYEGAQTVRERQEGLKKVYHALNVLREGNQTRPWAPSWNLEAALNDLYNRPNLDATADVASISPALNTNVVQSGPIYFKGNWSYVTAGPKMGFGLLPSDEGIAFYNSQAMTSVTPISSFQQQVAADRKGRRAAKLYQFGATSTDQSQLTITAVLRPSGLAVAPGYLHHVSAAINSTPVAGKGLGRFIASLLGFNQARITDQVYQGAIGKIVQGVVDGASELGQIKAAQGAAQKNGQLSRALVGNDTLRVRNFEIAGLTLRSRPDYAIIGGTVHWAGASEQVGADTTQPPALETVQPGVAADIHLASLMTNLTRGYLQSPDAQQIENLMIVTRKIPPGAPPSQGIVSTRNADFATFLKAIDETRAANDPKVLAARVKRPGEAPEFAADKNGHLVALVHDFLLEVAAPPSAAKATLFGPAAKVYRFTAPNAEFVISFKIAPASGSLPVRLAGRIEDFDAGPGAQVFAVNDDEAKPTPLPAFTSVAAFNVFAAKLRGQPIDIPLGTLRLPNFALTEVSPLDPSGWIRVVLSPTGAPTRVATQRSAPTGR